MSREMAVGETVKLTGVFAAVAGVAAQFQHVLLLYPMVAFAGVGAAGALAGWAFSLETGRLDGSTRWRGHLCFISRRLVIGTFGGLLVWTAWPAGSGLSATGMLLAGCMGAFPVEIFGRLRDLGQTLVERLVKNGKG